MERTACTTECSRPGLCPLRDEGAEGRTRSPKNRSPGFSQPSHPNRPRCFLPSCPPTVYMTSAKSLFSSGPPPLPICKTEGEGFAPDQRCQTMLASKISRKASAWMETHLQTCLPHQGQAPRLTPPAAQLPMTLRALPCFLLPGDCPQSRRPGNEVCVLGGRARAGLLLTLVLGPAPCQGRALECPGICSP